MGKKINDFLKIFCAKISGRIIAECGHETPINGSIYIPGGYGRLDLGLPTAGVPEYCIDCIEKAVILCVSCGQPIIPGSPIIFYTADESEKKTDDKEIERVKYSSPIIYEGESVYVSCVASRSCYWKAMFASGKWKFPGEIERIISPWEVLTTPNEKGNLPESIYCSDTNNPEKLNINYRDE